MRIDHITTEDGDWEGIYVNGVLKEENHSLATFQVLESLGLPFNKRELTGNEMDALGNSLPKLIEELDQ